MRLSISSFKNMSVRTAIVLLLATCALWCLAVETVTEVGFGRVSRIRRTLDTEKNAAIALRPELEGKNTVLVVGNSLLENGVDFGQFSQELPANWKAQRFVVLNTGYYDWYYGLRLIFNRGARPKILAVVLSPAQLIGPGVQGEYFAQVTMDRRDLLNVRRDIRSDNTTTANMFFSNISEFYGSRAEIRRWILAKLMPDLQQLTGSFQPPKKASPPDDQVVSTATARLRQIRELCAQYNTEFVMVVPPLREGDNSAQDVETAGQLAGVKVLVPIRPGNLDKKLFKDGQHLNENGAAVFTPVFAQVLGKALVTTTSQSQTNLAKISVASGSKPQ
jgi:hypothetical protein